MLQNKRLLVLALPVLGLVLFFAVDWYGLLLLKKPQVLGSTESQTFRTSMLGRLENIQNFAQTKFSLANSKPYKSRNIVDGSGYFYTTFRNTEGTNKLWSLPWQPWYARAEIYADTKMFERSRATSGTFHILKQDDPLAMPYIPSNLSTSMLGWSERTLAAWVFTDLLKQKVQNKKNNNRTNDYIIYSVETMVETWLASQKNLYAEYDAWRNEYLDARTWSQLLFDLRQQIITSTEEAKPEIIKQWFTSYTLYYPQRHLGNSRLISASTELTASYILDSALVQTPYTEYLRDLEKAGNSILLLLKI